MSSTLQLAAALERNADFISQQCSAWVNGSAADTHKAVLSRLGVQVTPKTRTALTNFFGYLCPDSENLWNMPESQRRSTIKARLLAQLHHPHLNP